MPESRIVQFTTAAILALVFGVLYFFAPPDKAAFFSAATLMLVGFIVGKFSNGYPRAEGPESAKETKPRS